MLVLPLLGAGLLLARPAGAALAPPTAPMPVPAAVEGFSPYLGQITCDPVAKPGTRALQTLLLDTYGPRGVSITRACGVGGKSEHKEGRALDWMLNAAAPPDRAIADSFLAWLLEAGPDGVVGYNARRLGVMYVIWNRQVWSSYTAAQGWKPYSGPSPHTDHIHISLSWAGALKETSFWTGKAAPIDYGPCVKYIGLPAEVYTAPRTTAVCPPPVPAMSLTESPLLKTGSTGAYVAQLQTYLHVAADGVFGPKTSAALAAFQVAQAMAATGTTDVATWARLRTAAPAPDSTLATPSEDSGASPSATAPTAAVASTAGSGTLSVSPKPSPPATLAAITPTPSRPTPGASATVPSAPVLPVVPVVRVAPLVSPTLTRYAGLTVRRGARGAAVAALQKALRLPADGVFGSKTAAAVLAFNTAHHLQPDGVVRPATWRALAAMRPA